MRYHHRHHASQGQASSRAVAYDTATNTRTNHRAAAVHGPQVRLADIAATPPQVPDAWRRGGASSRWHTHVHPHTEPQHRLHGQQTPYATSERTYAVSSTRRSGCAGGHGERSVASPVTEGHQHNGVCWALRELHYRRTSAKQCLLPTITGSSRCSEASHTYPPHDQRCQGRSRGRLARGGRAARNKKTK